MAELAGLHALLEAADDAPGCEARTQVIRSLVSLRLTREEWQEIAPRVLALADAPPGTPRRAELLSVLAEIPLASAMRRLETIAADEADPDRAVAAQMLAAEPTVAEQINRLTAELAQDPLGPAVERLAVLPIEEHGVDAGLFESAAAAEDISVRLWAVVARARLGYFEGIPGVLAALGEGPGPEFMWGDPWSAYDALARARPVPAAFSDYLLTLERPRAEMSRDAALFIWALTGNRGAEGEELSAPREEVPPASDRAPSGVVDTVRALLRRRKVGRVARQLTGDDALRVLASAPHEELEQLASLQPERAGHVLANLVSRVNALDDYGAVLGMGNRVVYLASTLGRELPLPVDQLLASYVSEPEPRMAADQFAFAISRAPRDQVMGGLARLIREERHRREALALLGDVAEMSTQSFGPMLGAGPSRHRGEGSRAGFKKAEPPDHGPAGGGGAAPVLEAPPVTGVPPGTGDAPPAGEAPVGEAPPVTATPPAPEAPPVAGAAPTPVPSEASPATRTAYPRIDCDDVVVVGKQFDIVIGLAERRDRTLVTAGGMALPAGAVDVDVLLTYDPESLQVEGSPVRTLHVTDADPYPTETIRVTALDGEDLTPERRIGAHFLVNGAVVGLAWRSIVAVLDERELSAAPRPESRERELLDLSAVAKEDAPDLILAAFRADTGGNRFTWVAYPPAGIKVPDASRSYDLGEDAVRFATNTRRTIQQGGSGEALFDWLHGMGRQIGASIPDGIVSVIRAVAGQPGRTEPPTVLLFTEEVHVPWELAAFRPPLATPFGGTSPFLGAHVALGRWLLSERRPRPTPQRRVEVRELAVFTAKYDGVARWPALPAAEEEAAELQRDWPPSVVVQPLYADVMQCLRGSPPADVMHFALHGQFDPDGVDEGLVLLAPKPGGGFGAQYLQAPQVYSVDFPRPPFVFLNACQVGAMNEVLGDYAGMAGSFLRAGAAGVVAPLWNVDDRIASRIAREFYRQTYGPEAPPVAEVLRRVRAGYTRESIAEGQTDAEGRPLDGPTMIAYQLFGHPRLKLVRQPATTGGSNG